MDTLAILLTIFAVLIFILLVYFVFLKIFKTKKVDSDSVKISNKGINNNTKEKTKKPKSSYSKLNLIEKTKGDLDKFEENLYKKDSSVGLILGARGSGKSALGMRIAENFVSKTEKNICTIGFNKGEIPSYIKIIEDVEQIPNNSFVLIDEGGIFFSSRDFMNNANKLVSKLILIARHKDLSILFITQNSSNIDVNIIRQSDYLMLKPSSLLQLDFERAKVKIIYEEIKNGFEKYKSENGLFYIYSTDFTGFVTNGLSSFWNTKISKSMGKKNISKKQDL